MTKEDMRDKAELIVRYNNPAIGSYSSAIRKRLIDKIEQALLEAYEAGKKAAK